MMKMSLSIVAELGLGLIGRPVPDAERWNAMYLPSGDQEAEPPLVSSVCCFPSALIKKRSTVLTGSPAPRARLLSNTMRFPSRDNLGNQSPALLFVSRRGFPPPGSIK